MRELLHRKDGSPFLFDAEQFAQTMEKINQALAVLAQIPEILSRYEDTEERSKSPEYVRGVLSSSFAFILKEREDTIREKLSAIPLGKTALSHLVEDTLAEIPTEIESELDRVFSEKSRLDPLGRLKASDIEVTKDGDGKIVLSLRSGFEEDLRKRSEIGVNPQFLEDCEVFRGAIRTLWDLMDKGYNIKGGIGLNTITGLPFERKSIVSRLMEKSREERESSLDIPSLFEELSQK